MPRRKCTFTDELRKKFPVYRPGRDVWEAECTVCKAGTYVSVSSKGAGDLTAHMDTEKHKKAVREVGCQAKRSAQHHRRLSIKDSCKPASSNMTDLLTRGFRAQLTTTMDSVLKKALNEIMQIFDDSLHDHQMALQEKGEEVAHLKTKLHRAEIKLRDLEHGESIGMEIHKFQMSEIQKEPEVLQNPAGQTSEVPEIDFEVPDDWCAPLGCETMTRQQEDVCPSVRLRPLLIPLWRIPVIKEEVCHLRSYH
ncbi:uncharacterized protein LOC115049526 [Echeneis naucrates]|uniref:uncharacterized protein LOC115049526 n=1 Tax=Echeneis naucrates TaxID=173247 RepID=UPI00111362A2|nr:uncharacterized protein LOC115049526 [Echeneis naucrates]